MDEDIETVEIVEPETSGRRNFLRFAATAAVGAAVAAISTAEPASATGTAAVVQNSTNQVDGATYIVPTSLMDASPMLWVDATANANSTASAIRVQAKGSGTGLTAIANDGYAVTGSSTNNTGVRGSSTFGTGLYGFSDSYRGVAGYAAGGVAVYAQSDYGIDLEVGGTGRLLLSGTAGHAAAGPPTNGLHATGEILRDTAGTFWACVAGGTPGTWRSLGGVSTAGQLHVINPTRVYDSRIPTPVPFNDSQSRLVSVADGINPGTGAVVTPNVVPAGAIAVAYNLTIAGGTGTGFLSIADGTQTSSSASAINWTPTSNTIANGGVVPVDATRSVKVFCGGGAGVSCNFILDITGYYL